MREKEKNGAKKNTEKKLSEEENIIREQQK